MKKLLSIILIVLVVVSSFGCTKVEETSAYEFEYKFKEEYSDKIGDLIAQPFIMMTKDVVEIYKTS